MANEAALINRKKDPNFNFVKVILLNFFHLRFFIRMCLKIKNCYYFVMINFANLVINLFLTLQKDLVIHFLLFNYQNFNFRLLGVAILIDLFIEALKYLDLQSSYQQTVLVNRLLGALLLTLVMKKVIQYQVDWNQME